MRRIYLLWLLRIIMLMPISLTSCSDDNIGSSNDLIGTWESVSLSGWYKENKEIVEQWEDEPDDDFKIVFNEDGTFESYERYYGQWHGGLEGTWTYKGGKIYMRDYEYDEEEVVTVKKLTSSQLVTEYHHKHMDTEEGIVYEEYQSTVYRKISD